jgi:hypothetical protein
MVAGIDSFRDEAGGQEAGFDGAIRAKVEHPYFFREGVPTLIIFVSDEHEQSLMDASEFHVAWFDPHLVAAITGPESIPDGEFSCAEAAPEYHTASQVTIDICTTEPWSIIDQIVE